MGTSLGAVRTKFIPTSIKSRKIFRASRFVPFSDKGVFLAKVMFGTKFSLGIIATKKIGGAVDRNYIRRRIKHAFISSTKNLKQEPKVSIVLIAKKDASKVSFTKILEACDEVIKSIEPKNL